MPLLLAFVPCVAWAGTPYQEPSAAILEVLRAPALPVTEPSPDSEWLFQVSPVSLPPLAQLAAPMLPLAGVRINPRTGGFHSPWTSSNPALVRIDDGAVLPLAMEVPILESAWSADSERVALLGLADDHVGLWIAGTDGIVREVPGLALVPLLGGAAQWLPDQRHLLVKQVPRGRGAPPPAPPVPEGPIIRESSGEAASSTYEARDLLASAHDDTLFSHFASTQLAIVDVATLSVTPIGSPDVYGHVSASPDGRHLLVDRLRTPWSHRTAWQRFAHDVEVWTSTGTVERVVASLPVAEEVPIHGVPTGLREVRWRSTADATLVWAEALDGGDPAAKVPHRDRIMQLRLPAVAPTLLMEAVHRVTQVSFGERGLALIEEWERERRWRHVWTVNADKGPGSARAWFNLSSNDRYADPGSPVFRALKNGAWILRQDGDSLYFKGAGASPGGDRPFLDRRSLRSGAVQRLFRSGKEVFERVLQVVDAGQLIIQRESPREVPNVHLATLGGKVSAVAGEAVRTRTDRPLTRFTDPTPILRGITKKIVTYPRADGVPLSFTLYLPPGYAGGALPTVVAAYPREFSDPATAGQVSGSEWTFNRFTGASFLFFALDGYAVLQNTTMPVIGDPDTAYDTFVVQLVSSAEAAVDQAVKMGVTDRNRVGVIGHSHGGLMTATLLAHSDLFGAGIARSGAYNHTIRPFGFQSERRTLWEAKDTYIALSPVMFAPQIDEPLLLIHGEVDENPGTVPLQSERLYEAVRGTGGTVRLVMLPHEGHGYMAEEWVEHVLWEQLGWFNRYVKKAPPAAAVE